MYFLNRKFVSKERVLLLNQQEIMASTSSFSFYVEFLSKKKTNNDSDFAFSLYFTPLGKA